MAKEKCILHGQIGCVWKKKNDFICHKNSTVILVLAYHATPGQMGFKNLLKGPAVRVCCAGA